MDDGVLMYIEFSDGFSIYRYAPSEEYAICDVSDLYMSIHGDIVYYTVVDNPFFVIDD